MIPSSMTRRFPLLILLLLSVNALHAESFKLLYLGPTAISPDEGSAIIHQFRIMDVETGRVLPTFLIEAGGGSQEHVTNGSLSAINMLCKHQLQSGFPVPGTAHREEWLLSILALVTAQSTGTPLVGKARAEYLQKLELKTSRDRAAKIASELPEYDARFEGNSWVMSYPVLTDLGAIERHQYEGEVEPFRVRQQTVSIVTAVGELPEIQLLLLSD